MTDALVAFCCCVAGVTLLRAAWYVATADTRHYRRDYPHLRAVFMGKVPRSGRRRSMLFSRRRGRIEFH